MKTFIVPSPPASLVRLAGPCHWVTCLATVFIRSISVGQIDDVHRDLSRYALRTSSNGTYFDLSTKGREITRAPDGNLAFPTAVFVSALNSSIFLESAWGAQFDSWLQRLVGAGKPLVGARHYYRRCESAPSDSSVVLGNA